LSKGEPKVEGLHYNPIHQEIVGGIKVNYGYEVLAAHRFYNDIALLPGTGKLMAPRRVSTYPGNNILTW
jgi:hypothetical protein